ncbi:hypothetical protein KR074_003947 [Drosophila pseudoananassae]|nr:hypothetical protein KR074_003947 [Drosophila pseudoananassae]
MFQIFYIFSYLIPNILLITSSKIDLSKVDCSFLNATWESCPSPCPETCEFLSRTCPVGCGGPCACRDGYIMDGDRKSCVLRSQCPAGMKQRIVEWHYPITIKYFGFYRFLNLTDDGYEVE